MKKRLLIVVLLISLSLLLVSCQGPLTGKAYSGDNPGGDDDSDTILNSADNCPNDVNTDQVDYDGDLDGDVCDVDDDNDQVNDVRTGTDQDGNAVDIPLDNCPQGRLGWDDATVDRDYDDDGCLDSDLTLTDGAILSAEDDNDDNDGVDDE